MSEEIFCLRALDTGAYEPPTSLVKDMNEHLDAYAQAKGLSGDFTARSGQQFKIATDELQYYIVRTYATEDSK